MTMSFGRTIAPALQVEPAYFRAASSDIPSWNPRTSVFTSANAGAESRAVAKMSHLSIARLLPFCLSQGASLAREDAHLADIVHVLGQLRHRRVYLAASSSAALIASSRMASVSSALRR